MRGKEEPLRHFIHLLYTILRHRFKQQRIGKSLANQQNLYLLWGTGHVLGLPHSVHRPMWLYSSVHHNSIQISDPKMPKVTPSYQRSQHTATTHSDTHAHTRTHDRRKGQWYECRCSLAEVGCLHSPLFYRIVHRLCKRLEEEEALLKRERHLIQIKLPQINLLTFCFVINTGV